ncbi:aminotransferase class I/II-fold pyridoxal phosphate-dependent enzyme [Streptomyces sp. NPDC059396]|uniref:aminotransferase class I/II-fold pyridoxal phosphate-dependent enzyme n=1 Tax=Streptomyces sp. NPDC059396 TaxID=3346819 RepID=UPI0036A7C9D6
MTDRQPASAHFTAGHITGASDAVRHHDFSSTPGTTAPGQLIGLDIADMDFSSPPAALEAVHARANRDNIRYTLASEMLRGRIRDWYADRHDWQVREDEILLLPFGVKAALRMALETCADLSRPVVVCTPVYSGILKVTRAVGAVVRTVPLTHDPDLRYTLDPQRLADEFRASGAGTLVLCSPHNPVGRVWLPEELAGVAAAAEQAGVLVMSDEVHSDLTYPGVRHRPWATVADNRNWIVLHSAGKTFNVSGLQTSFAVTGTPVQRRAILSGLSSWGYYEGSFFGDAVAQAVLAPSSHDWLDARVRHLAGTAAVTRQALTEFSLPLPSSEPEAGFLLWIDARALRLSGEVPELAERIRLHTGVRLLDGTRFGASPGFLRLNFATAPQSLFTAMERLSCIATRPGPVAPTDFAGKTT